MGTMIQTSSDVVRFFKAQHQIIRRMFEAVLAAHGEARASSFFELRRLLAVHEAAEEEVVHPVARHALPDGDVVVAARLREEFSAKKLLTKLETLEVDTSLFTSLARNLMANLLTHANAEENDEFARLGTTLDASRLDRMRKAVELAEDIARTRRDAGLEFATAGVLAGPFATMVDRSRDAISGRR